MAQADEEFILLEKKKAEQAYRRKVNSLFRDMSRKALCNFVCLLFFRFCSVTKGCRKLSLFRESMQKQIYFFDLWNGKRGRYDDLLSFLRSACLGDLEPRSFFALVHSKDRWIRQAMARSTHMSSSDC